VKKQLTLMVISLAALSLAAGCNKEQTSQPTEQKPAAQQPAAAGQGKSGKVIETMNSGGYTYVQVDTGSEKVWAAAPEFKVKVGDAVAIPEGMPRANYESQTLKRKFDVVYFVDAIMVGGAQAPAAAAAAAPGAMPQGHPPVAATATEKISGIKKADMTVAELFAGKDKLAGKQVGVRGKVVKFSPEIMGKNWIHLQDGTGAQGTNDLTVTTKAMVKVGDTVLVNGPVSVGKDFGYGYKYDVIVEDAQVKVE
jgi:ribosomal protein S17